MKRETLMRMLETWAAYHDAIAPGLGWNVNTLDFSGEVPRGVQKRNDRYSDPVVQECHRMQRDQREAMIVDASIRDLPRQQRRAIYAQHCRWPDSGQAFIASKLGTTSKALSRNLNAGYSRLSRALEHRFLAYRMVAEGRQQQRSTASTRQGVLDGC